MFRTVAIILICCATTSSVFADAPKSPRPEEILRKLYLVGTSPHSSSEPQLVFKNSPAPVAYALSPNKVVLSSGLLDLVEDESEVAFIIAHEMAHLTLGHIFQHSHMDDALTQELDADREALVVLRRAGFSLGRAAPLLDRIAGISTPDGTRLGALYPLLDIRSNSLTLSRFL